MHLESGLFSHGCPGSLLPSFPLWSLCKIGPLNHTVPFHPSPCRHWGVTSAWDEFCHKSWLYFMLQCILFTRAKTSSLGILQQATFPYTSGVSNRNKQMQSQGCFLCKSPWNASKFFFFSRYLISPGWQTSRTVKMFVRQFCRIFPFTKHWKNCKGEHQSGEFICVTNEEDSYFFLVVMKFAKLLMSALVSLSDDLVPVELFHLSC